MFGGRPGFDGTFFTLTFRLLLIDNLFHHLKNIFSFVHGSVFK